MADVKVRITAEDQGSAAVRNFSKQVEGINDSVKGAEKAWQKYTFAAGAAVGALAAVGKAAQIALATLNEGAALDLAQSRFDNLAKSIGTTSEALTGQMTAATSGMISQAQLVASASDMISLGLADSGDEVVRLSNLVGQLGWDMQVLTLTMANDSMLRLDALGLSMENVKAKMEELKAAGVAADEAFDLAVIAAGEEKLALMGSAADTTAGKLQILQASIADVQNAFSMGFAEGFTDALDEVAGSAPAAAAGLTDFAFALGSMTQYLPDVVEGLTSIAYPGWVKELAGGIGIIAVQVGLGERAVRQAADAQAAWADDLANTAMAVDMQREAIEAATAAQEEYNGAIKTGQTEEGGIAIADSRVAQRIQAFAGLVDAAAEAMARGADKAGVMAGAIKGLEDIAGGNALAEAAEAAEALAATYEEAAQRMAGAFTAALGEGGGFDFGNVDAMATAAWDMAQAFDLTAPQIGEIGIAIGEITPQMADAAVKAALFQEAWGILLGQFGAGNIDTAGLMSAYDALIADLNSKSLVEIQVELKQVENPARESWAWLPKEERQVVEIPVEFTPEQAALQSAIDMIDGIPEDQAKLITFDAEYETVTTAITTIQSDIAAIDATVLMTPEAAEVDAKIEAIDESRLTVYVDFVAGDAPVPPGRAAGGPVTGSTPYWVGEQGPEIFVPWTSGSIVPNHRIGSGDGGGVNLVLNFYGATNAGDVRRAAENAGARLIERIRQAGVTV